MRIYWQDRGLMLEPEGNAETLALQLLASNARPAVLPDDTAAIQAAMDEAGAAVARGDALSVRVRSSAGGRPPERA